MAKLNNQQIVAAVLIVIAGAGGFAGGTIYAKAHPPARGEFSPQNRGGGNFGPGGLAGGPNAGGASRNRGMLGGLVTGEIIEANAESLTVKLRDGGSKIVYFSGTTTFGKTIEGTSADLKPGQFVLINGMPSQDGTVTASTVDIRPASPQESAPTIPSADSTPSIAPPATN